jgi:phospholipase/carboxylesterase
MKIATISHLSRPVLVTGAPLDNAHAAMVMLHGRGASARDILTSVPELADADCAYLAPEAPGGAWYPRPFRAPLRDNEPYLSASLALIAEILALLNEGGLGAERVILFGFSQGACLGLEYAARHAQRYGGIVGLSGGLIGPDDTPREDGGSMDGSPVFLGCSDADPFIPQYRVENAADWFEQHSAAVTLRLYTNMEHTVNENEMEFVRGLMANLKAL